MYIEIPNIFTIIVITIVLLISAYMDYKTTELNLVVIAAGFVAGTLCMIITGEFDIIQSLIGLAIGAIPFLILAFMQKGGGGDVLLMGMLGWCIQGNGILYVLIFSILIYVIYSLVILHLDQKKEKNKKITGKDLKRQFPFAPAVLVGWIVYIVLGIIF